jgi:hypothetical protein
MIFILLNEFVLIDFVSILGVNLNQAIFVYTLCFFTAVVVYKLMLNKCFACYRLNSEQTQQKLFEGVHGGGIKINFLFFANCSTRELYSVYWLLSLYLKLSINYAGQARNFERCFL